MESASLPHFNVLPGIPPPHGSTAIINGFGARGTICSEEAKNDSPQAGLTFKSKQPGMCGQVVMTQQSPLVLGQHVAEPNEWRERGHRAQAGAGKGPAGYRAAWPRMQGRFREGGALLAKLGHASSPGQQRAGIGERRFLNAAGDVRGTVVLWGLSLNSLPRGGELPWLGAADGASSRAGGAAQRVKRVQHAGFLAV